MNFFFGYIYYRIARHFLSMGRSSVGAVAALSAIQTLLLAFCIKPLAKATFSVSSLASTNSEAGFVILILSGVLIILNFWVHVKKYNVYELQWGNENFKTRTLKGTLVVGFLFSPLLLLWWLQYQPWF